RDEDQYDDRVDDDYDDRDSEQDDNYDGDDADEYEDEDEYAGATKVSELQHPASGLSAADAARAALRHIAGLIDKPPLGVIAVKPSDEGWTVTVEMLEDGRIPSSADILALYDVDVDVDGTLRSYQRMRRFQRGRADGGGV